MLQPSFSFSSQVFKKLRKNRLAFAGLITILVSIFIAIFGYLLAPDNSPFADNQTVEIQAKKPGYTQLFLKIPKQETVKVNWAKKLFEALEGVTNGQIEIAKEVLHTVYENLK